MSDSIFWIIISILIIGFLVDQGLNYLSDKGWDLPIPKDILPFYSTEKYIKAKNYHKAGGTLGLIKTILSLIILLAVLFFDGFGYYDEWIRSKTDNESFQLLLFLFLRLF